MQRGREEEKREKRRERREERRGKRDTHSIGIELLGEQTEVGPIAIEALVRIGADAASRHRKRLPQHLARELLTHARTHTHTHSHSHSHTHSPTHSHTATHSHTQPHTALQTQARHARTHAHPPTCASMLELSFCCDVVPLTSKSMPAAQHRGVLSAAQRLLVSGLRWRALYLCLSQRGEGGKKN